MLNKYSILHLGGFDIDDKESRARISKFANHEDSTLDEYETELILRKIPEERHNQFNMTPELSKKKYKINILNSPLVKYFASGLQPGDELYRRGIIIDLLSKIQGNVMPSQFTSDSFSSIGQTYTNSKTGNFYHCCGLIMKDKELSIFFKEGYFHGIIKKLNEDSAFKKKYKDYNDLYIILEKEFPNIIKLGILYLRIKTLLGDSINGNFQDDCSKRIVNPGKHEYKVYNLHSISRAVYEEMDISSEKINSYQVLTIVDNINEILYTFISKLFRLSENSHINVLLDLNGANMITSYGYISSIIEYCKKILDFFLPNFVETWIRCPQFH